MIKYLYRHDKDYSRYNIIKQITKNIVTKNDIFILMAFSKNQFFKNVFKRDRIINDFFISNYDTYVYDRKKITKKNPRAWWKYFQDWCNFRYSKYLLSDTQTHFEYWEELFGKFKGEYFILPVLADKTIYYPNDKEVKNNRVKIIFYGSFIPLHGIDVILNAFKTMENGNIDFEAKIIGTGQNYPQMYSIYKSLDLKNVVMTGELIDEQSLAEEIRSSDIILGIFGNSKKAKSVIPNKVYQATACAKCTVTMKSKVLNEFYSDEDIVTCDNTPSALSKTLTVLVNDNIKRDTFAKNGYLKFTKIYDDTVTKFADFINKVDN